MFLDKTLEELDGQDWGEPTFQSGLVINCHRLRQVPLKDWAADDLGRFMLDYDLDDGKGTELVHEIVNGPSGLPLIATSSHLAGNQALLNAGANAVCSKMDFANIEQVIASLSRKQILE